jgi:quercetin dioxygenase-like cupin family protein
VATVADCSARGPKWQFPSISGTCGEAAFQIGKERLVVPAGHVVVSPPGEAHAFVNHNRSG